MHLLHDESVISHWWPCSTSECSVSWTATVVSLKKSRLMVILNSNKCNNEEIGVAQSHAGHMVHAPLAFMPIEIQTLWLCRIQETRSDSEVAVSCCRRFELCCQALQLNSFPLGYHHQSEATGLCCCCGGKMDVCMCGMISSSFIECGYQCPGLLMPLMTLWRETPAVAVQQPLTCQHVHADTCSCDKKPSQVRKWQEGGADFSFDIVTFQLVLIRIKKLIKRFPGSSKPNGWGGAPSFRMLRIPLYWRPMATSLKMYVRL